MRTNTCNRHRQGLTVRFNQLIYSFDPNRLEKTTNTTIAVKHGLL